jgi:hypothetical protein
MSLVCCKYLSHNLIVQVKAGVVRLKGLTFCLIVFFKFFRVVYDKFRQEIFIEANKAIVDQLFKFILN